MIFKNSVGEKITELGFSVQRGSQSPVQAVTIQNPFSVDKNITLYGIESPTNQLGRAIDTYQSQFFSLDNQSFVSSLPVTVPGGGTLVVYTKFSPPDQAVPGNCEWTFHHEPNEDLVEGPLGLTKKATITMIGSTDGAKTNYPVQVTIPYQSYMRSDFGDIRFVDADGSTILSYNRVSYTASSTATFDVLIPSLPASPSTYILTIYSGNSSVVDDSDPTKVYQFNDDGTGDTSKWTPIIGEISSTTLGGSQCLEVASAGGNAGIGLIRTNTFQTNGPFKAEWDVYIGLGKLAGLCYCQASSPAEGQHYQARVDVRSGQPEGIIKDGTIVSSKDVFSSNQTWVHCVSTLDQNGKHNLTVGGQQVASMTDVAYTSGYLVLYDAWSTGNYSGFRNIYVSQYTANPPTIQALSSWQDALIKDADVEVKAGIQYAKAEIEGLDYNPSFGVWIGDVFYE